MLPAQTSAVPNDLALWDAMRIGTVGTGDAGTPAGGTR